MGEQYQDLILGDDIQAGVRVCADRYEVIRPLLSRYQRPFTVLDIGANMGYFSFRIAQEFDAVAVMVESRKNDNLLMKACKTNEANVVWLRTRVTPEELRQLAQVEHFDVVLALNVLHHLGGDWKSGWESILKMADHVVVESPVDAGACGQKYLEDIDKELQNSTEAEVLGTFTRHTGEDRSVLRCIESSRPKSLEKAYWTLSGDRAHRDKQMQDTPAFVIQSDFKKKTLMHEERGEQPPWVPGINAMTFRALSGAYPTKKTLRKWVKKLPRGSDCNFWNLIVSGLGVTHIDQHGEHESFMDRYI